MNSSQVPPDWDAAVRARLAGTRPQDYRFVVSGHCMEIRTQALAAKALLAADQETVDGSEELLAAAEFLTEVVDRLQQFSAEIEIAFIDYGISTKGDDPDRPQ